MALVVIGGGLGSVGGDLRHALSSSEDGRFKWHGKGRSLALDIAHGLHFLHSSQVHHRDITSCWTATSAMDSLSGLVNEYLVRTALRWTGDSHPCLFHSASVMVTSLSAVICSCVPGDCFALQNPVS